MELVNQTPLAARVEASEVEGLPHRIGMLTAKATFRFDLQGRAELETQEPFPLFPDDVETPLGLLPSDAEPRRDDRFEVILLGHAYAPAGRQVEQLTVALTVGAVRREIVVVGDRFWIPGDAGPVISRPQPFAKLPLTWARAYGGSQPVKIDPSSTMVIADAINAHGRGFDAQGLAWGFAKTLESPAGYPILENYRRALPNLEDPRGRVARWTDEPDPICWATVPRDVLVNVVRRAPQADGGQPAHDITTISRSEVPSEVPRLDHAYFRAHREWILPPPLEAPLLSLENLSPERPVLRITVPPIRVVGDYVVEGRRGSRALSPLTCVLLPDDHKFYIVYATAFTFPFVGGDERSFRLRIADGWYPEPAPRSG